MKTYDTITDLIGSTPLLKLNRFAAAETSALRSTQSSNTSIPPAPSRTASPMP